MWRSEGIADCGLRIADCERGFSNCPTPIEKVGNRKSEIGTPGPQGNENHPPFGFRNPQSAIHNPQSGWSAIFGIFLVASAAGCYQEMSNQPKYKPLAYSALFGDSRSARPLVPGTVARGRLENDELFYSGKIHGYLSPILPFSIDRRGLARGRERFEIFCTPCHDRTGSGHGLVVQRGYRQPPSYHIARLREVPIGYIFDVITRGFGAMPDYAAQVPPRDRWLIASYVRALQRSQDARLSDAPEEARERLRQEVR
jgi:cbb3-type cytochrome c oxidase subunit III